MLTDSLREEIFKRAEENAARGMARFDRTHPGWEKKIRDNLDMSCSTNCFAVHLTGLEFSEAIKKLQISNPVQFGLDVRESTPHEIGEVEYHYLTQLFLAGRNERLRKLAEEELQESGNPDGKREEVLEPALA